MCPITGTPLGLLHATRVIYKSQGVLGLFQGHSATLLRIFPYAGIKFMAYERLEHVRKPISDHLVARFLTDILPFLFF